MRRPTARLLLPAALALLAGCGASPVAPQTIAPRGQQPIVGGVPDTGDASVNALVVERPDHSGFLCSGTVIGPHSFLTAAHCVTDLAGNTAAVVLGQDVNAAIQAGTYVHVDVGTAHPLYHQPKTGDWNDIGMVHTVEAMPGPYLPPNRYPLDRIKLVGQPVREVGFGETAADGGGTGLRRQATQFDVTINSPGELREGPQNGLSCNGDSGGPQLFQTPDGLTSIISVTSRGDVDCTQLGIDTRVDAYLDFIDQFLADHGDAPSCGSDGRCAVGCADPDPDCPCSPDGLCTSACSNPSGDPDCAQSCLYDGGSCLVARTAPPPKDPGGGGSGGCGQGAAGGLLPLLALGLLLAARRLQSAQR